MGLQLPILILEGERVLMGLLSRIRMPTDVELTTRFVYHLPKLSETIQTVPPAHENSMHVWNKRSPRETIPTRRPFFPPLRFWGFLGYEMKKDPCH